jgi:hypothetical protein
MIAHLLPALVAGLAVLSVGFLLAEKTPGPFALEVAWIKVLRGPGR